MTATTVAVAILTASLNSVALTAGPAQTTVAQAPPTSADGSDPFLWLEEKDGARAIAWVRQQNQRSLSVLQSDPHYRPFYQEALHIAESPARIPFPAIFNGAVYNFWQDATHVRGIWRRTTLRSYQTAKPAWHTVIDVDALARAEGKNWVWEAPDCAEPQEVRCMVAFSEGGEDAQTLREFDLNTQRFVANGFVLPRGKQSESWENPDTLLVSREWQPGDLTASGYPYIVKRWQRAQPLSSATEVFRGQKSDVSDDPLVLNDGDGNHAALIRRGVTFFTSEYYIEAPGGLRKLNIPAKSDVSGLVHGRMLLTLNEDWNPQGQLFHAGSLAAVSLNDALTSPSNLHPTLVWAPQPREALESTAVTKNTVLIALLRNVRGRALVYTPTGVAGWRGRELPLPENATIGLGSTDLRSDAMFVTATSFLMPSSLYYGNAQTATLSKVKALPPLFNSRNDVIEQLEATSRDGTKVPYFIVRPKNMRYNGANPTILNAYGGFQISETPTYSATMGKLWLERKGVFALANIRGGGEFGPAWHEAGLKTNRQRIYDDFYAVGKDLIARKITSPRRLGIVGGSNGGL
ncbi:MAG: S9 family peptidase, partial [Candidatus Eremiobacteraeota bacterium]|nr:S9 family peptidase [Candidatus Eremiobacteraeota bacterium]